MLKKMVAILTLFGGFLANLNLECAGWSPPVPITNQPGAEEDVFVVYDVAHDQTIALWKNLLSQPVYSIWNGSSWSAPVLIDGASSITSASVIAAFGNTGNTGNIVIATWSDSNAKPTYAIWNGSAPWQGPFNIPAPDT